MRVITANVNGIRAAVRRGGPAWLAGQAADVITLQEVRASDAQLRAALHGTPFADWHLTHAPSASAGRAGVAVLSRAEPVAVRVGLGPEEFATSGGGSRLSSLPSGGLLTVVSAYIYSGERHTAPGREVRFLGAAAAARAWSAGGVDVVVAGDVNIAHRDVDIKNWKGNRGKAGFLPEERAYLDRWFDDQGWVDLGRRFGGRGSGPVHVVVLAGQGLRQRRRLADRLPVGEPGLAERALKVEVDRAASYAERFSDHAPVVVDYAL